MQKLYRSELDGKRALVFFDNARDARQVMPLLPPASCLLLITSREHFTLPGLRAKDLNVLPPDKARELLLSIADRLSGVIPSAESARDLFAHPPEIPRNDTAGNDTPANDTVGVADLIAQLCGCLPQALRASASLLAETIDLDPCDYARQLRDERKRLQRIGVDPASNLDMEASLSLSYRMLTPEAQRVLARLSVFPADFRRRGRRSDMRGQGPRAFEPVGEVESGAIQPSPQPSPKRPSVPPLRGHGKGEGGRRSPLPSRERGCGGEGRYSLHDLVRLFARARLPDDERTAAQRRHAEHYENVLSAADDLYLQGNESIAQGLALFDREWANIQAGQQWTAANAQDDEKPRSCATHIPTQARMCLDLRLHPRDHIRWLQDALNAARQSERPCR